MLTVTVTATLLADGTGATIAANASGGSGQYTYTGSYGPTCKSLDPVPNASGGLPINFIVDSFGVFTATITATDSVTGATGTGTASFTIAPIKAKVTVAPASVAVGVPHQLRCRAFDQFNNEIADQTYYGFTWTASSGTITSTGEYTGSAVGVATITATYGSATGTRGIDVVANEILSVVWPAQLAPGVIQTVTFSYYPSRPDTAVVTASSGTVGTMSATSGRMLTIAYTAPASGSVTFTDTTSGVSATVSVGPAVVPIRKLSLGFYYKRTPGDVKVPSPIPGGLQFSATGPNGETVSRLDTSASIGPPDGTPFLAGTDVGTFIFYMSDPAPEVVFRYFYKYNDGERITNVLVPVNGELIPPKDPNPTFGSYFSVPQDQLPTTPPVNGLTSEQSAQLAAILASVSQLSGGQVSYNGPVAPDGRTAHIIQGDDVALQWTFADYAGSSLTGATAAFGLMLRDAYDRDPTATATLTTAGQIATSNVSGGSVTVTYTVPLTASQTSTLPTAPLDRPLNMVGQLVVTTTDGKRQTAVLAAVTVSRRVV